MIWLQTSDCTTIRIADINRLLKTELFIFLRECDGLFVNESGSVPGDVSENEILLFVHFVKNGERVYLLLIDVFDHAHRA